MAFYVSLLIFKPKSGYQSYLAAELTYSTISLGFEHPTASL